MPERPERRDDAPHGPPVTSQEGTTTSTSPSVSTTPVSIASPPRLPGPEQVPAGGRRAVWEHSYSARRWRARDGGGTIGRSDDEIRVRSHLQAVRDGPDRRNRGRGGLRAVERRRLRSGDVRCGTSVAVLGESTGHAKAGVACIIVAGTTFVGLLSWTFARAQRLTRVASTGRERATPGRAITLARPFR